MILSRLNGLLVFLIGVSALLGLLPAYDPSLGYGPLAVILIGVALYFVTSLGLRSWRVARVLSYLLLLVGTGVVAYFLTQYSYGGPYRGTPEVIAQFGEKTTILPDLGYYKLETSTLAALVIGLIPVGLSLLVSARRVFTWLLALLCTLVLVAGVAMSAERGAILALAVGAVVIILLMIRRRPLLVILFLVALAAAGFALMQSSIADTLLAALLDRYDLYRNSVAVGSDYMFTGIGIGGTFSLIYSQFGLLLQVPFLEHPHNLILGLWMGNGLLGLLALLGLFIVYPFYALGVMRSSKPRRLFFGLFVGVVMIAIHGLFDLISPLVFLLMGMSVALGHLAMLEAEMDESIESPEQARSRPYVVLGLAGVVVVIAGVVLFNKQLQAAWYTNLGAVDETRSLYAPDLTDEAREQLNDSARANYEAGLAIDPLWSGANRRLGNLDLRLFEFEPAVPLLERALIQDAGHPAGLKGLGLAYTWVGQIEDAAATFELLEDPDEMQSELYTWGYFHQENERHLQTAYSWETAQAMAGYNDSNVLRLIGQTYMQEGVPQRAEFVFERVLDLVPEDEQALEALESLGSGTG